MPASRAASAMGRMPLTPRRDPVRESSPKNAACSGGGGSSPEAARIPTKMGRSYKVPAFFCPAGARLTVIRLTGKRAPQFFTAARTRSRASRTAASGSPTISKAGRPPERKHSAFTSYPAIPLSPKDRMVTTMMCASFFFPRRNGTLSKAYHKKEAEGTPG